MKRAQWYATIHYGWINYNRRIGNQITLRPSGFALWIDGECYGVFSRVRDAVRKYSHWLQSQKYTLMQSMLPSWIEDTHGNLVRSIVGQFPYAN